MLLVLSRLKKEPKGQYQWKYFKFCPLGYCDKFCLVWNSGAV